MAVRTRPPRRTGGGSRPRGARSGNRTGSYERVRVAPDTRTSRGSIELPRIVTVKELSEMMTVSPVEVIKELMKNGIMASINQSVDYETAAIVAGELGFEASPVAEVAVQEPGTEETPRGTKPVEDDESNLISRPPVVTIMGHVDHGKTSLLDAVRQANVTATEAGGITQHIGAYQVEIHGQRITFLDTPGHEAFTAMRARGAQATDVAVLVVAADDGVMPQTKEAIDHARAAGVPIVVAINKIDKPNANPDRVKQELADYGVLIEEWGGEVLANAVSAKRKEGLDSLLESILLVAEMEDLRANPDRPAVGVVIESKMDKQKGPLATVLVQTGTLNLGDYIVVGGTYGKVKAMFNDKGKRIKKAGPATPAEILGLSTVAPAGETIEVVTDEKTARTRIAEAEKARQREASVVQKSVSLDDIMTRIRAGDVKELDVVLKTDVQGSIEPIRSSLERLQAENVKVNVIHAGTGNITESDVNLAVASKAIVVGFNTRAEPGARNLADAEGIDIRLYSVIYELVGDVEKALTGMLEPKFTEVIRGHGEVRQVFKIGRHEQVAGCYILDGKFTRNSSVRVSRDGKVVGDAKVAALKRFKEDVREVAAGFECGVTLEGYHDFQVGDKLEFYGKEKATS
ncbi:MAG: translation initiation factor IF-2 [Chloroflexota bacterium]|nr:MAG: translation initiation factor IF-2 [Chloroflexota bacterium]